MSSFIERLNPAQAKDHVQSKGAVLVNAYEDQAQYEKTRLPDAKSLADFRTGLSGAKEEEIIFYCACPDDATATRVAEEYHGRGYKNVKVLRGGFNAWNANSAERTVEAQPLGLEGDAAVERGEGIATGKTIARGGRSEGHVSGAMQGDPPGMR